MGRGRWGEGDTAKGGDEGDAAGTTRSSIVSRSVNTTAQSSGSAEIPKARRFFLEHFRLAFCVEEMRFAQGAGSGRSERWREGWYKEKGRGRKSGTIKVVQHFQCWSGALWPPVGGQSVTHRATGPPSRRATGPPGRRATGPPGHRATGPPGHRATGPPGHRATGPPGHRAAGSPSIGPPSRRSPSIGPPSRRVAEHQPLATGYWPPATEPPSRRAAEPPAPEPLARKRQVRKSPSRRVSPTGHQSLATDPRPPSSGREVLPLETPARNISAHLQR